MPADQIPGPTRSRNLMEAHFKSLRAFRKWCRYMPMFVAMHKYEHFTTPEQAKLQLARVWRQNGKIREPGVIDEVVRASYERLYSAQQIDFWGGQLLDLIAPLQQVRLNRFALQHLAPVGFIRHMLFVEHFYQSRLITASHTENG